MFSSYAHSHPHFFSPRAVSFAIYLLISEWCAQTIISPFFSHRHYLFTSIMKDENFVFCLLMLLCYFHCPSMIILKYFVSQSLFRLLWKWIGCFQDLLPTFHLEIPLASFCCCFLRLFSDFSSHFGSSHSPAVS